jgi:hypothetical protein
MIYDEPLKNANRSKLRKNRPVDLLFRARFSASRALLKSPIFGEADRVAQRCTAIVAVGAAGTLPADYVGFPALPGLPPASPIYIPQTGGFEIT